MIYDDRQIQALVDRPRESLSIELKRWLDLSTHEHQAIIVKACMAMRNNNGGFILIGFDDEQATAAPLPEGLDPRAAFHVDKIQPLISKCSSIAFDVEVCYPTSQSGQLHPVICVPAGVRTPVAMKCDFAEGAKRLQAHSVYVRSQSSNHRPSSTLARSSDWERLIETCFNNREADIGSFLKRHLTPPQSALLSGVANAVAQTPPEADPRTTAQGQAWSFLDFGLQRYEQTLSQRGFQPKTHGSFEVSAILAPEATERSLQVTDLLLQANPDYTGWPIWVDSRGFDPESRPYVMTGGREALILSPEGSSRDGIDFWRIEPRGRFYHRRGLEDDFRPASSAHGRYLDPALVILRTAEAIAVATAMSRTIASDPTGSQLQFAFRWQGLSGRTIWCWSRMNWAWGSNRAAMQGDVCSSFNMPLEHSDVQLEDFVSEATKPLFEVFDCLEIKKETVSQLVQKMLKRSW